MYTDKQRKLGSYTVKMRVTNRENWIPIGFQRPPLRSYLTADMEATGDCWACTVMMEYTMQLCVNWITYGRTTRQKSPRSPQVYDVSKRCEHQQWGLDIAEVDCDFLSQFRVIHNYIYTYCGNNLAVYYSWIYTKMSGIELKIGCLSWSEVPVFAIWISDPNYSPSV